MILRKVAQQRCDGVLIDMDNRPPVTILRFLIDHDFMQRERWEEKEPAGAHGVLAIIDDHHAKPFFDIENFQTLMPVLIAHGIGKKATKRRYGVI